MLSWTDSFLYKHNSIVAAPPEMLLVQSKGPAGETHGDMMGIYELLPSSHNNKPVWEQDKKKWKLFYTKGIVYQEHELDFPVF